MFCCFKVNSNFVMFNQMCQCVFLSYRWYACLILNHLLSIAVFHIQKCAQLWHLMIYLLYSIPKRKLDIFSFRYFLCWYIKGYTNVRSCTYKLFSDSPDIMFFISLFSTFRPLIINLESSHFSKFPEGKDQLLARCVLA